MRLERVQKLFAALAHPARRQILLAIHFRGGAMSSGDIAKRFSCAWPTTVRHIQTLEEAGLLRGERKGRAKLYRLDRAGLGLAREWLDWFDKAPGKRTLR